MDGDEACAGGAQRPEHFVHVGLGGDFDAGAAGLDMKGNVIRERTYVNEEEIEANKTASPVIGLNFPSDNRPAQLKLELTGVRLK